MFENREICVACGRGNLPERSGRACGRKPDMYAKEKSDTGVVPKKGPNKVEIFNAGGPGGKAGDRGKF
jgi:hypothetical protein